MKLSRRTGAWMIAAHAVLWVGIAVLLPGAVMRGARAQEGAADAGRRFRLAVVDLDMVLTRSEQWADHQEESQRLRETSRLTLEKYERQVRVLRLDLQNLPPGAPEAAAKRDGIEKAMLEYRQARDGFDQQLGAMRIAALGTVFNDINSVIEQHAREHGLDLVLKKQDLTVSPKQPSELGVIIATANVLYARDSYDITDAVVEALNARYPEEIKDR